MKPELLKARIKNLRGVLKQKKLNALIVCKKANVTYLTGFTGDDSWLVVTGRAAWLMTDSRYTAQAKKQCHACKIFERNCSLVKAAAKILQNISAEKTTAVEDCIEVGVFDSIKKQLNCRIRKTNNLVEQLRVVKHQSEFDQIIKAGKIAADALAKTRRKVRLGMTENEFAGMIDFAIRQQGSRNSFETIVAFGPNAAMAHHQPGKRKLRKNDTILIDYGAVSGGYRCDVTRCFATGKVSLAYAKIYNAVFHAQQAAIAKIAPGVKISEVEAAAKSVLAEYSLPAYAHGTGHGLGLEVHEAPFVSTMVKGNLKTGQVITIEPGVYIDGKFGVRIEDDILVTETGAKILTTPLKNPNVPKLKI